MKAEDGQKRPIDVGKGKGANEDQYASIRIDGRAAELHLGVWNLKIASNPDLDLLGKWKAVKAGLPLFARLALDIFHISPRLFVIFIFCQFWEGVEEMVLLHQSNNVLRAVCRCISFKFVWRDIYSVLLIQIEAGLVTGKPNAQEIIRAVVARLLLTVLLSWISWYGYVRFVSSR